MYHGPASPRPASRPDGHVHPDPRLPLPPLASLALPLAAQSHQGEADMQSSLPADAASLREPGSIDSLHRGAVSCEVSLADGAEGLHFSAI